MTLDLARYIRPGDGIVFGQATGEPLTLTEALVQQRAALSGSSIFFGSGFSRTFQPAHADHLRFSGIGGVGTLRKLATSGVLDPVPCHISSVAGLIRDGTIRCDVAMVLVSPSNDAGEHSFGVINDYVRAAIASAREVIAEVNEQVPWTPCDHPLRREEITAMISTNRPVVELLAAPFGDTERAIAKNLQDVIPDRATLQVGIGGVPEAIIAMLGDRRDLGIHSGMVGDSVVDLMERGVVTNAYKGIDPGVTVTGSLIGTERLYRFADRNPAFRLCPSSYTHASSTIASVKQLVSLNSALEVDLTGQVNAEAIGSDYFGAVGGQVDFVRGASLSEGGVSIVALAATGKNGESKIVASLSGPVTTPRSDVDIVATEYGIARLRGRTIRERIRALAAIAAPQHRDVLIAQARETWGTC
ncbi:acetyl-CoA hydrolase/transferase family protein [Ottowia thiooxydans]|uniref:Acyl-CoA hydrolase n=1 Tax=Ottowia thiooxydans TaxID=219182 RepID=A0ABV2Q8T9_9BURK